MSAQFFSSLADNALLVAADRTAAEPAARPSWHVPALAPMFALFYVILAPLRRRLRRRRAQGQGDVHLERDQGRRLPADAVRRPSAAGLRASSASAPRPIRRPSTASSPSCCRNSQLVKANGWIEGLTILSIILGVLLGGQLLGHVVSQPPARLRRAGVRHRHRHRARGGDRGDRLALRHRRALQPAHPAHRGAAAAARRTASACWCATSRTATRACGTTSSGQISLATTTLFWGVSGNLRVIVFAWAAAALGYTTTQASSLVGVVAIGTAAGAIVASLRMRLDQATQRDPATASPWACW